MPLVPATLEAQIKTILLGNCPSPTQEQQAQINQFANQLAMAVDAYIKTGTVTGTCATPSGAGTILGVIS